MFTIEIDIARPTNVVFDYLVHIENTPLWYSAVEQADQVTPAPVATGARFRFLRQLPSGPAVNDVAVTEFVPDSLLTLASLTGPTPFTYRYSLSPLGANTRLRLDGEISGDGLSGPLALLAPLAPLLFERGMRVNLATLKRLLENDEAQTSRTPRPARAH